MIVLAIPAPNVGATKLLTMTLMFAPKSQE